MIEIKVPSPGESITQVQLAKWLVGDGEMVEKDQEIAEIDSDKATLSISAQEDGQIKFLVQEGDSVDVGAVIATIDTEVNRGNKIKDKSIKTKEISLAAGQPTLKSQQDAGLMTDVKSKDITLEMEEKKSSQIEEPGLNISPLAKKLMQQNNVSEVEFLTFLKGYRIGKRDVEFFLSQKDQISKDSATVTATATAAATFPSASSFWPGTRDAEHKKMSTLRLKLSERLVAVKNQTAMLTTFNEVNMTPIMEIRKKYKDKFKEKYGISLGFMSFFTKAVTEALQIVPGINAQIDKDEIVYFKYADIGIAVSSPKGLMVPVLRNAEKMSLAEIEIKIKELADKARTNKLTIDEMTGGTFTITNGGVFGSMLSTPILNPPQSAILGMHNVVERPIAVNGKVEIHPIMFVALSYDHRIIDGRESVTFLVKVKEMLEEPSKMLFGGKEPVEGLLGL
jgi:2-oxoglutarate dehydrogenase E2 component (dihydrolipoamide succinyltransferase)